MNEYRASARAGPTESAFGPFKFHRAVFTDSIGRSTEAWGCSAGRLIVTSRAGGTRANAVWHWLLAERKHWAWELYGRRLARRKRGH